jgi:3-dehydroquinate dehydratase-2
VRVLVLNGPNLNLLGTREADVYGLASLDEIARSLRDAIAAVRVPVVEVHLSNVYAREPFRRRLVLAPACAGVITGLGPAGYHLAVRYLRDFAPRARGAARTDA